MNRDAILQQVGALFRDVLDDESLVLVASTTASDVPDWDSLSHVQLVVAVEKHFRVRFTAKEIQGFKNVGEMCDAVSRRLTE